MASSSDSTVVLPIRVYITQSNGSREAFATVWDSKHAMYIRNRLRLLGDFCGTLPKHIAQNQYLSLPLVLSYEETVFGVMKEYFTVVCDDDSDYAPHHNAKDAFWKRREDDILRQVEESVAQQLAERERRKEQQPDTRRGRKRMREEVEEQDEEQTGPLRKMARTLWQWIGDRLGWMRRAEATTAASTAANDAPHNAPHDAPAREADTASHTELKEEGVRQRLASQARATALVVTSTAARADEGARRARRRVRRPACGNEKRLRERLLVLQDLHERGYFVSCGAKFGADFLAYAGSPQMFHAAAAVVVVSGESRVAARGIVAMGRLGDATKKRAAMAFVDDGVVRYVGVQWEETLP